MAQLHRRVTEEVGFPMDIHQRIAFFNKYGTKYVVETEELITNPELAVDSDLDDEQI